MVIDKTVTDKFTKQHYKGPQVAVLEVFSYTYKEKELICINTDELTQEQSAQAQETSFFISNTDSRQQYAKILQNALNARMFFPEAEINFEPLEVYRLVDYSEKENAGISRATWN